MSKRRAVSGGIDHVSASDAFVGLRRIDLGRGGKKYEKYRLDIYLIGEVLLNSSLFVNGVVSGTN
jgi:hypothetical protein